MKFSRFLALVLALCLTTTVLPSPALARETTFEASGSVSDYVDGFYAYASVTPTVDDNGYTLYEYALPENPTIYQNEYYANSLSDYQKAVYRGFMDGFSEITPDELMLMQKVRLFYSEEVTVEITSQEEFDTFILDKLAAERAKMDMQTLYNAIQYDHTELFWMRGAGFNVSVSATYQSGVATLTWKADMMARAEMLFATKEDLTAAAQKMNTAVDTILASAPTTTDYDKIVYFNDWLKENNTYNQTHFENNNYPLAHGAYSAFTSNNDEPTGPVCQGYAYALKYLCDKVGIENVVVSGILYQTNAAPGPHAWNLIKLDGNWYAVDVTANDGLSNDTYNFLVGSDTPSHDPNYPNFSLSHVNDDRFVYPTLFASAYTPPPARLSGDVNEDGAINGKDFAILRQFLNEWEVEINESNADVNADGNVNGKDMALLRQYLNDWDVVLK